MKIISIQEAYQSKFARQKRIKGLQYHASGHCVHIGRLSPGCYTCFAPNRFWKNIMAGVKCNLKCSYCITEKNEREPAVSRIDRTKKEIMAESCLPNYDPRKISFSGGGEPLLYMDVIEDYMHFLHKMERFMVRKPWYHLYTNGILADKNALLRLKDLGFDEIRFHLGASNFSKIVYQNLKNAVSYFKAVTIETPSWPLHRKKLFEMLPVIEDIGVKHLNLEEIIVNEFNYKRINRILPRGEIYHCYEMHLYDGGLVYEIMEEVLKRKYSYSVLDCNCFVIRMQRSPAGLVSHEGIEGVCAKY